jgi:valyl-tRNA synthetase
MLFPKPKNKPKKLTDLDQLFIDYIENFTIETDKSYSGYDFNHPAQKLRFFLWETFASHYIEMVKARAYNQNNDFSKQESESAKYTLHFLLERFLYLVYPIIPQVSTVIANEKKIDLLKADWPKAVKLGSKVKKLGLVDKIMDFNKSVWKQKKDSGLNLRAEIAGVSIPKELKEFEKDLVATHKII